MWPWVGLLGAARGGGGWCVPGWFAKTFVSHETVAIPDAGGAEVATSVLACGHDVPVDVYRPSTSTPKAEDLSDPEDPNELGRSRASRCRSTRWSLTPSQAMTPSGTGRQGRRQRRWNASMAGPSTS